MSGSFTYKLKGARWLRKFTAPSASPVYAAASDAQNIADTLCDVPWTRADSDGPTMFPQHDAKALDANPGNRDLFDAAAFCAEHVNGAHKVYANAAFYLFALPSAAQGKTLSSVKVHLASDPYNEFGARVAVHLLSSPALPTDCGTVRTGVAHVDGQMPRTVQTIDGVAYWYGASGDVTVTLPQNSVTTAYLGVFVGLENYARARGDWIEGASYIRNSVEIATADEITGWTSGSTETIDCSDEGPAVLLAGGSSPTWLQPLPTVNATDDPPTLANIVETFFTSAQTQTVPQSNMVVLCAFQTTYYSGTVTASMSGDTIEFVRVDYTYTNGSVTTSASQLLNKTATQYPDFSNYSRLMNPGSAAQYLSIELKYVTVHSGIDGATARYVGWGGRHIFDADSAGHQIFGTASDSFIGSEQTAEFAAFLQQTYYLMIQLTNGVPTDMDRSTTPTLDGRQYLGATIEGSASPWSVMLNGISYSVEISGSVVTLGSDGATLGTWSSIYDPNVTTAFDPAANIRMPGTGACQAVARYGLAATVGDFSHAVATFEAGTLPSDAEMLGRLARMSRAATGGMLYLHPASAALADELDALRPVPRFFRTDSAPPEQTDCQPGLSVWYRRPTTTEDNVTTASSASAALAYRNGASESVVKVTNPAFLQLALLALRAPSAFASRLVLENVGVAAVHNGFVLRFVAWRCPAEQWDGSNGFAMAAMASMPSIYRSDGDGSVSWSVDCSGALMPLGTRMMTAERIGVSQAVPGEIAANAQIAIPLVAPVGAGDVVLISPEVLGFADGTGAASVYFGRQDNPAGTGEDSAESHNYAWARYPENLGWFPHVIGE